MKMNSYGRLNLRPIAAVAIAFAIGVCLNCGTPKIYAKSGIRELSAKPFPGSARNAADHDGAGSVDVASAEERASAQPSLKNYINLSFAYWEARRYRDCVRAARLALEIKPDFAVAYNNIAAGYQSIARMDSAIDASSEAIRLSPGFSLAQNNLNWELARLRRIDENVEMTERAASSNPTSGNYVQLSQAYYDKWRYGECIEAANKALASGPDQVVAALAYNNICAANIKLGQWDSAIVAGKEALRIDPTFDLARNNLRFAMKRLSESSSATEVTSIVMNGDNERHSSPDATNQILPLGSNGLQMVSLEGTSVRTNGITLEPCYPNPTSYSALIGFSLSERSSAKLTLYDFVGREVQSLYDGIADPGAYSVTLNAASLPSGVYEYILNTPAASLSRSVIISK
jgi:tetratricopeptide (TPR) repeat protein